MIGDIAKLFQTRWNARNSSLQRILDNYESLIKVGEHCLYNDKIKSELKGRIIEVKVQMQSV